MGWRLGRLGSVPLSPSDILLGVHPPILSPLLAPVLEACTPTLHLSHTLSRDARTVRGGLGGQRGFRPPLRVRLAFSTEDSGCLPVAGPTLASASPSPAPRQEPAGSVHLVNHAYGGALCRWPAGQRELQLPRVIVSRALTA